MCIHTQTRLCIHLHKENEKKKLTFNICSLVLLACRIFYHLFTLHYSFLISFLLAFHPALPLFRCLFLLLLLLSSSSWWLLLSLVQSGSEMSVSLSDRNAHRSPSPPAALQRSCHWKLHTFQSFLFDFVDCVGDFVLLFILPLFLVFSMWFGALLSESDGN